jgi:predicted kinase
VTGRIVIVSGPPGAGKSTIARRLAEGAPGELAAHLHTDDVYTYIRKGFVAPWLPQAQAQNIAVMNALAASAAALAVGGYEVVVDGIIGPWFFDPWLSAANAHAIDLRYIALAPDEATTVARATARTAPGAMTDAAVVRTMWGQFQKYAPPAGNVVDTTGAGVDETVAMLTAALAEGRFRLG